MNLFGEEEPEKKQEKKSKESKKGKKFPEPKSFEEAMAKLEELVSILEEGKIPLEESIEKFEYAQFLARWCQKILDRVEGKLKLLIPGENGEPVTEDLDDLNPV